MLLLKRVYDPPAKSDGTRILVDRMWPRGLSKENAKVDLWLKDIAPSDSLRKWFNHEAEKWAGFKNKYRRELEDKKDILLMLKEKMESGKVTILFAAKDTEHNNAVALKEFMEKGM